MGIKISSADAQRLMKESASKHRKAAEELKDLKAKVAFYERKERATKLAQEIQAKGLSPEWGGTEQATEDHIMNLSEEELQKLEGLVGLAAPHNPLAAFERDTVGDDGQMTAEENHPFVQYLLGNFDI